jgi:hypothetical protein
VHAFITEGVPKPVSEQSVDGRVNTSNSSEPEERYGFDRLLFNNAYSEIEVHAIRLQFHAIMMRVGIEKTNETSESLLENEERWLNKQLPGSNSKYANMSLDELRKMPTVLSKRNDLVLPRFYHQPVTFEREGTLKDLVKGFFIGIVISAFLVLFYMIWLARPS